MLRQLRPYLSLPREVTSFEREYLARMSRVAMVFFYLHVPVLMLVAALSGGSVLQAGLFGALALVGPTLAYVSFESPRALSRVFGFTAMTMGALLVHFGQGPMQIEMHFYFFVLLALLAVFADPSVILVAAATVVTHHLVFFFLLPRSVFNYEASLWTVLVHAIFVLLESIAACFVARSFFDNVIGLERIVAARTAEVEARRKDLRLILEAAGEGFITVDLDGHMSGERPAVLDTWLGPVKSEERVFEYLGRHDAAVGTWLDLGLWAVREGTLPLELALDQMPKRLTFAGRSLDLAYKPISQGERLEKLLIVLSDVTSEVEGERHEARQRELLAVFKHFIENRSAFLAFVAEADGLVDQVTGAGATGAHLRRSLHTLKGNCGLFGLESLATLCHEIESRLQESGEDAVAEADRRALTERWAQAKSVVLAPAFGASRSVVEVSEAEHAALLEAVASGATTPEILFTLQAWKLEPAAHRLEHLQRHTEGLARRAGKEGLTVHVEAGSVRLPPERWSLVSSAALHVVRNAIDHGIESKEEREALGKAAGGSITLRAVEREGQLVLEIEDDGRGIDVAAIAARVAERDVPVGTREQVLEAMFSDGLSTKDEVTELSGRGVGLAAVREVCTAMGGSIRVASKRGRGTRVALRVPLGEQVYPPPPGKGLSWSLFPGPPSSSTGTTAGGLVVGPPSESALRGG